MATVPYLTSHFETQRPQLFPMLPNDLSLEILRLLPLQDLDTVSLVCKEWNKLATSLWNTFDLKKLFPKLSVIDKDVWEKHIDLAKYGLSFKGEEFINRRKVIRGLDRMFATLEIEQDAGITLMSIPEGWSFPTLRESAKSPKLGNKITFFVTSDPLNDPVKNTYQIAITNCILKGTKGLSCEDQYNHLQKLKCDMPEALHASTLVALTYISSTPPTSLYSNYQSTHPRCSKIGDGFGIVGFFPSNVFYVAGDRIFSDNSVAAMRKFEAINT